MKNLICGCSASKKIMFVAVVIILLGSQIASAALIPTSSPADARVFTLFTDPATTFLASGGGNLNGHLGNDMFLDFLAGDGYVTLDKTGAEDNEFGNTTGSLIVNSYDAITGDILNQYGLTGDFEIISSMLTGYTDLAFGLKTGNNLYPSWAIFSLGDVIKGEWEISANALSHAILYGKPSAVPVPAAVWLFGSGLIGLVSLRRKSTA